jgi:hypothetical protein
VVNDHAKGVANQSVPSDRLLLHGAYRGMLGRFFRTDPLNGARPILNESFGLKSSTGKEATRIPVDDHALLNHATTESGRDMVTFSVGPIRPRSARLARNSANIQHAPIAATL